MVLALFSQDLPLKNPGAVAYSNSGTGDFMLKVELSSSNLLSRSLLAVSAETDVVVDSVPQAIWRPEALIDPWRAVVIHLCQPQGSSQDKKRH